MNCYQHPEASATAFCRGCGRALCTECQVASDGTVYCAEHAPVPFAPAGGPYYGAGSGASNPYTAPPVAPAIQTSPGLAFLLGLIPGVGAIYNGQYVKGLMHAVIFGLLISIMDSVGHSGGAPLFGILIAVFFFYMPFEAYHTARKRQLGIPLDEWSSIVSNGRFGGRTPIGPVLLILLGTLFLLDSLHIIPLSELGRFWPVLLILIGGGMLYGRLSGVSHAVKGTHQEIVESLHDR